MFALDTNGQQSALSARIVLDHARSTALAAADILDSYRAFGRTPKQIVIIGHSMGGLVARIAPLIAASDPILSVRLPPGSIASIIALAAPQSRPPIPFARALQDLYESTNAVWSSNDPPQHISNITLVSIASGYRDRVVNSALSHIHSVAPASRSMDVYASAIPRVWTAPDHEGAIWCNQILEAITDAIIDTVDPSHPSKFISPFERIHAFRSRLIGLNHLINPDHPPRSHALRVPPPWIDRFGRQTPDVIQIMHNHPLLIKNLSSLHKHHNVFELKYDITNTSHKMLPILRFITNTNSYHDPLDVQAFVYIPPMSFVPTRVFQLSNKLRLIPPSTSDSFKIAFRTLYDMRNMGRPAWSFFEADLASSIDMSSYISASVLSYARIFITVESNATGFLEASVDHYTAKQDPIKYTVIRLPSIWSLYFGYTVSVDTPNLIHRFVFPDMIDPSLRYRFSIHPSCETTSDPNTGKPISPLFDPFVEYGAPYPSIDTKFVNQNIHNTIISWYADANEIPFSSSHHATNTTPSGLRLIVYSSTQCRETHMNIRIHLTQSIGSSFLHHQSFIPAIIVSIALFYLSDTFLYTSRYMYPVSVYHTFTTRRITIYVIATCIVMDTVYPFLMKQGLIPKSWFLGPRIHLNPFGITFWCMVSIGTMIMFDTVIVTMCLRIIQLGVSGYYTIVSWCTGTLNVSGNDETGVSVMSSLSHRHRTLFDMVRRKCRIRLRFMKLIIQSLGWVILCITVLVLPDRLFMVDLCVCVWLICVCAGSGHDTHTSSETKPDTHTTSHTYPTRSSITNHLKSILNIFMPLKSNGTWHRTLLSVVMLTWIPDILASVSAGIGNADPGVQLTSVCRYVCVAWLVLWMDTMYQVGRSRSASRSTSSNTTNARTGIHQTQTATTVDIVASWIAAFMCIIAAIISIVIGWHHLYVSIVSASVVPCLALSVRYFVPYVAKMWFGVQPIRVLHGRHKKVHGNTDAHNTMKPDRPHLD